jgi:hypothetical protein
VNETKNIFEDKSCDEEIYDKTELKLIGSESLQIFLGDCETLIFGKNLFTIDEN